MRAAELIRSILDVIDAVNNAEDAAQAQPPVVINVNSTGAAPASEPVDAEIVSDETDSMVPPLQQQIELLKKAAGVASVYDDNGAADNTDARAAIMHVVSQTPVG